MQLIGESQQQIEAAAAAEMQRKSQEYMQEILRLLSSRILVVTRRFNRKEEGQPMIGTVSKTTLGTMIKKQLQIWMPHEMILMNQPIASYGEFKIPLNLKGTITPVLQAAENTTC
eukprot:jgi/Chrzof1/13200/Cz07g24060.t1